MYMSDKMQFKIIFNY